MKKASDELQLKLNEVASVFEKAAGIHSGIYSELHEHAKHLRVGDMVSAARATDRINHEHSKLLELMGLASSKLNAAMALDPDWFREAMVEVNAAKTEKARSDFAKMIENWTADKCRTAIEEHTSVCDKPDCDILPLLEERLARHEPH